MVQEHIKEIFSDVASEKGEKNIEFDLLIFTIGLSVWVKLAEGNHTDALRLVEIYSDYIKYLKTSEEKEKEVANFCLDLFIAQLKLKLDGGNIEKVLKKLKDEKEVPFSGAFFKVWKCLSDPESVQAQKYLAEKAIAEIVNRLKEKAKPQKTSHKIIDAVGIEHLTSHGKKKM